ncbi:hypothetical protein PVAND_014471 [Polypedilum vanderplanki]|uniref:C-type lectin domain-containing protein n=1 Tax=Polypedilum vanderplanki TaxID=319348 RepID=A0A9J6BAA4_POLVA|nr:hypothetical protein PVAND_014471 [Polypedilum vanderplanki]
MKLTSEHVIIFVFLFLSIFSQIFSHSKEQKKSADAAANVIEKLLRMLLQSKTEESESTTISSIATSINKIETRKIKDKNFKSNITKDLNLKKNYSSANKIKTDLEISIGKINKTISNEKKLNSYLNNQINNRNAFFNNKNSNLNQENQSNDSNNIVENYATFSYLNSTQILTTSICTNLIDLRDLHYNYIKTICWISIQMTYENGNKFCQNNNMHLFSISDSKIYFALRNYTTTIYGRNSNISLWVNGIQDAFDNNWYFYNPNKTKIYSNAAPDNKFIEGQNCLCFSNPVFTFSTNNLNCSIKQSFYCEIFRNVTF